ncbi:GNAT family N-acetyltransferase [Actinomadura sp. NAK00032]|uniref:GNAT family N-acetyltransferase n=1 Tax=Actinomadura sp. NAK00032 TaxID=2742128 RepID=UPI001592AAF5|nr:GNAT family protein [Actinomadura sp. NAK00032]QKW38419.1 GNAT family N-acetyltransferase [Actinomadura sp. NAK00032]
MTTARVRLRQVDAEDVAELERAISDPAVMAPFEWYGWRDRHRLRREWERDGLMSDERGALMAEGDDGPLCMVSWTRVPTSPAAFCWRIAGLSLPAARGRGYAAETLGLLVRYLFDCSPVHRIEAAVEVGNIASQRVCEKMGFVQEGLLRGYTFRAGQWRDCLMFSILRPEAADTAGEPAVAATTAG